MLFTSYYKQWWLFGVLLLFNSCQWFELKERQLLVRTSLAQQFTFELGIATGTLVDNPVNKNISRYGHCWDTLPNPTIVEDSFVTSTTDSLTPFVSVFGSLTPNTRYYVRSFVELSDGTVSYGENITFRTLTDVEFINALIRMLGVNTTTSNSAEAIGFLGSISTLILPFISEHGFCWSSTNPTPTITDNSVNLGAPSIAGRYTSTIDNLQPATQYFIRAYVKSNNGNLAYSTLVLNFTTNP
ncbi:hypothetical protein BKI52_33790 [marine bacterium AO1-C]|nr:hypothetical protein BKI52_33790 [marine bacterium AO1-C]